MYTHAQFVIDTLQLDLDCIFDEHGEYIDDRDKYQNIESANIVLFRSKVHPIKIGDNFLRDCENLTSIDLSPLSNVTLIGHNFLRNCKNLTSIDLSPFSNVTSISSYFLSSCENLTSIDLSPFSNVTSIGGSFLSGDRKSVV